jgi:anti-sigma B factor antagonist
MIGACSGREGPHTMSELRRSAITSGLALRSTTRDTTADVALSGELDMAAAFRLESEVDRILGAPGIAALVLDLANVSFVDSAGLGSLLSIREQASRRGIDFGVAAMSEPVRRILDATATRSVLDP